MSKTNQTGYEISYHIEGVSSMTEIVYADSAYSAEQLVKAKYNGAKFISGPFRTGNTVSSKSTTKSENTTKSGGSWFWFIILILSVIIGAKS